MPVPDVMREAEIRQAAATPPLALVGADYLHDALALLDDARAENACRIENARLAEGELEALRAALDRQIATMDDAISRHFDAREVAERRERILDACPCCEAPRAYAFGICSVCFYGRPSERMDAEAKRGIWPYCEERARPKEPPRVAEVGARGLAREAFATALLWGVALPCALVACSVVAAVVAMGARLWWADELDRGQRER